MQKRLSDWILGLSLVVMAFGGFGIFLYAITPNDSEPSLTPRCNHAVETTHSQYQDLELTAPQCGAKSPRTSPSP